MTTPDADSVQFWTSVAGEYRKHQGVLFGVFNVPHSRVDPARASLRLRPMTPHGITCARRCVLPH